MSRDAARLLLDTLRLDDAPVSADAWGAPLPASFAAVVQQQGAATWLLRRLADRSLLAAAPPDLAATLRAAATRDAAACQLVDAECAAVLDTLATMDVRHVLLKGVARRALAAEIPYADARLTRDVDVLLPEADAPRVWDRLVAAGYSNISTRPPGAAHYHLPALLSPSRVAVELHTSITPAMSAGDAWRGFDAGARTVTWLGREARVPAATQLLEHAMSHAATDMVAGYRLRALLDGAVMLQPGVDGVERDGISRVGTPRMRAWLGAAAELAGAKTPGAFPLERTLAWQMKVYGEGAWPVALAEAAVRVEADLPAWSPPADGSRTSLRRIAAGMAARLLWLLH